MTTKGSMAGWIGFAGVVMFLIGGLNMFQGLVAVFDDEYFVPTGRDFLLVDLTTWGWMMMIWGALLARRRLRAPGRDRVGTLVHDRARRGSTSSRSSAFSGTATTRCGR